MFGLAGFWNKSPSPNALGQFIPNRLPKHVITSTNCKKNQSLITFLLNYITPRVLLLLVHQTFNTSAFQLQKQPTEVFYIKKAFLKISQNSQENTCARVFF